STWYKDPTNRSIGNISGWVAYRHMFKGETRPREGKLTVHPVWKQHAFVLPRAIAPIAIQYISIKYFRLSWPMWMAGIVYSLAFITFVAMLAFHLNALALKHGFLDGQVPRDGVPDARLKLTMLGIFFVATVRLLFCCFIAYNRFETLYITPWLSVHMFVYTIIVDFWFYIYHRAMHEIDEVIGILIIPLLAYLVYPSISSVYTTYTEVVGHSGVRLYQQQPVTGPILRPFGMDMAGEDHDLHHRNGWRKSFKYTRIWDKLLSTARAGPRLEMVDENVDW
ncbi:hypothetical protein BS47DRAFT_1344430, partial [Hydnum rufescens UP504]